MKCKYIKMIITAIICLSLMSCQSNDATMPSNEADYLLNQLTLGLSYVPDSSESYQKDTLTHLQTLNINHVRMALSWALREPNPNEYNMEPMAKRLAFYESNHIDLLVTIDIKAIPEWAQKLDDDDFLVAYREFIKDFLAVYGHQISTIQFGNEWDWEIDLYLNGDVALFNKMNNILYDEVSDLNIDIRPKVALGSISIGGLRALAFDQGFIKNVTFKKGPLYSEAEVEAFAPRIKETSRRAKLIMSDCKYDLVDIHLYDDYWNWQLYVDSIDTILKAIKKPINRPFIVSEFGGPEPTKEPEKDEYRAHQLYYYIQALDQIGIKTAYYFKLHEHVNPEEKIFHPYSYLISKDNKITKTYEIFKLYGERNTISK